MNGWMSVLNAVSNDSMQSNLAEWSKFMHRYFSVSEKVRYVVDLFFGGGGKQGGDKKQQSSVLVIIQGVIIFVLC